MLIYVDLQKFLFSCSDRFWTYFYTCSAFCKFLLYLWCISYWLSKESFKYWISLGLWVRPMSCSRSMYIILMYIYCKCTFSNDTYNHQVTDYRYCNVINWVTLFDYITVTWNMLTPLCLSMVMSESIWLVESLVS